MKKVDVITEKYVDVRRELKEILVNAVMSREEGLEKRIKYLGADCAADKKLDRKTWGIRQLLA